ncbi:MAG TPA: biopolymer transporter ExbD [Saprospiraceae bacterium]|nr:biopolymer transporter ExbD [Saprospiraceae bacterium]
MRHRMSHEIAAGAMADIAFLLLIFFMIATKIESDQGLLVQLPPYNDTPPVASGNRKALQVLLNADDQIMVSGQLARSEMIDTIISDYLLYQWHAGQEALIALQANRQSTYAAYVGVYDILYRIRNRWRDRWAMHIYHKIWEKCSPVQQKFILEKYGFLISEKDLYLD